jgi:tetratricopeptide (TPR) repeat protein
MKFTSPLLMIAGILLIVFCKPDQRSTKVLMFTPVKHMEHFALGYNDTLADSLWLRLIQNMDSCSSVTTSQPGDPLLIPGAAATCSRGWNYQMLDAITDLAPRFQIVYRIGATILSVISSDVEGAKLIFDKGLKVFPNDWGLAYRAAYHYLYDIKDNSKAAELLMQAHRNGGPPWLPLLAGRLYSQQGSTEVAIEILSKLLAETPEGPYAERMRERIEKIRAGLAADLPRPETRQ